MNNFRRVNKLCPPGIVKRKTTGPSRQLWLALLCLPINTCCGWLRCLLMLHALQCCSMRSYVCMLWHAQEACVRAARALEELGSRNALGVSNVGSRETAETTG